MAEIKEAKLNDLIQDDRNLNKGTERGQQLIEKSLREFGAGRSVLIDKNNRIIAGNKTHKNAELAGLDDVIIVETDGTKLVAVKRTDVDLDTKKGREMALADNATTKADLSWDTEELNAVAEDFGIDTDEWDVELDEMPVEPTEAQPKGSLVERFVVPPFSVLDTRQGYWRERKRIWREKIGDNGESRQGVLSDAELMTGINGGTSILDPVMAELVCRWFCVDGGNTFDCFAGDTIFGYVAAYLGNTFTGIELREEQARLNNERVVGMNARYICDDGQNVGKHIAKESQDLLFSCPPYYDLEVYSDDPKDASNQKTYEDFLQILDNAFTGALQCLRKDRFACIVVGDIRDENGYYRNFVNDIVKIFERNGVGLYNELIIVEPIGTLPQRVGRYMKARKVGKCHQNLLVFYKGDTNNIKKNFKEIQYESEDLERFEVDFGDRTE